MVGRSCRFFRSCSMLLPASITALVAVSILLGLAAPSTAVAGPRMDTFCREHNPNAAWECTVHPIYSPNWTYGFAGMPASQCSALPDLCHHPDHPFPFDSEVDAVEFKKGQWASAVEATGDLVCDVQATPTSDWYDPMYRGFEYHTYLSDQQKDYTFTISRQHTPSDPCVSSNQPDILFMRRYPTCNDLQPTKPGDWIHDWDPDTDFCRRPLSGTCPHCNPLYLDRGERRVDETDIRGSGGLTLQRVYRSRSQVATPDLGDTTDGSFGALWQHNFEKSISVTTSDGTPSGVLMSAVLHGLSDPAYFYPTGTIVGGEEAFTSGSYQKDRLAAVVDSGGTITGWKYFGPDDAFETYDANGRLTSVTSRQGATLTLSYDANDLLETVADGSGRALTFIYDSQRRVSQVLDPDGQMYSYAYGAYGNLVSVTYPMGSGTATKQYQYSTGDFPNNLTGVVDEKENQFATYTYDANGRASTSTQWASPTVGVNGFSYAYPSATATNVTDSLGVTRTFSYATVGGVVRETGLSTVCPTCTGNPPKARTYDTNGNVLTLTDFNDNKSCYSYDTGSNLELTRVEGVAPAQTCSATGAVPAGARKTTTQWHPSWRLASKIAAPNSITTFVYNGDVVSGSPVACAPAGALVNGAPIGVLCSKSIQATSDDTGADGFGATATSVPARTWSYTYDSAGHVISEDGPRTDVADVTTYTYRAAAEPGCASNGACTYRKGDLWKVTNALGQITEYVSYDKNGRVTRVKDANGTYTDFVYHARGWLTERSVRESGSGTPGAGDATLHIDYDAVGNVTKVTQPDGAYLQYAYDDAHRLIKITDNLSNGIDYCPGGVGTADCLDAAGNRKVEQVKDASNSVKRQLHRVYNQLGQLTQVLNAANVPVETSIGINGTNIVDGYDRNGNRVLSDDGFGTRTQQDYDPLNRLKATIQDVGGIDPSTSDATTQYAYDARDNLRQVTDPDGLPTVYDYDGLSHLTGLHSPDTGDTAYTYDAAGNRMSQTDARGVTSAYTYDALNRLTSVTYPDADLDIAYAYDGVDATTGCSGSHSKGRLTTMGDFWGATHYCYDRRGNVTKKIYHEKGKTAQITLYSYTLADRLASILYPSGARVIYARDALGRVQGVAWQPTILTPTTTLIASTTYAPFGPLTSITYGNGRTQTRAYDQNYAIDAISGTPAGALTLEFEVDVMGNIVEASDSLNPVTPDRVYTYDPMYRLTKAETGATPPASLEAYTYNPTGDRLSASLNGNPADTYAYVPNTHRLASVGATARTYDDNGNTLTGLPSGYTLTYDDRNRLRQATKPPTNTATYRYNGKGERMEKAVSNGVFATVTAFAYDEGGRLLGEYDDAGNVLAEYVYLEDMPIAVIKDAAPYYVEADHLGTPRQVIDPATNAALWKWELPENVFGANSPNDDPDNDGTPFVLNLRFPGQRFDPETGLNYNYFRDYDSISGRYIESDPIGVQGGIATYAFVRLNPLKLIDSSGESPAVATLGPMTGYCQVCVAIAGSGIGGWWLGTKIYENNQDSIASAIDYVAAMAAPGNVADTQVVNDYGRSASDAKLKNCPPPDRCEWLEENASRYRPDQVKSTAKAWGCKGSRWGKGRKSK